MAASKNISIKWKKNVAKGLFSSSNSEGQNQRTGRVSAHRSNNPVKLLLDLAPGGLLTENWTMWGRVNIPSHFHNLLNAVTKKHKVRNHVRLQTFVLGVSSFLKIGLDAEFKHVNRV